MHPASIPPGPVAINPVNSDTTGVSNACIKTLLFCFCWPVPPTAVCTRFIGSDPARWTAVDG